MTKRKHWKNGVNWETFAKKHDIASSKTHDLNKDEIIVPVQQIFPNCQKYDPCCKEAGYEETVKKAKKIHNFKEMIDDMLESVKEKK